MSTQTSNTAGELHVVSLEQAHQMKNDGYSAIISIESSIWKTGRKLEVDPGGPDHLVVIFDDLESDYPDGFVPPGREDVKRVIDFARKHREVRCLIHCFLGVSRSTACALAILADRLGPGREAEALAQLLAVRPEAVPNRAVVREADALLERNGALIRVLDEWDRAQPYNAEYRRRNRIAVLSIDPQPIFDFRKELSQ